DALALAGEPNEGERNAPDQRADPDREERTPGPERRDQERAGDHHEQADRQVEPQDGEIETAEVPPLERHGTDPPRWRLALEDPLEAFGDARHVRFLRRCDPDQVPRVAGGGPRAPNPSRPLSPVPRTPLPPPDATRPLRCAGDRPRRRRPPARGSARRARGP